MQRHEKDRNLNLDDSSRFGGSSALSASLENSKRGENEIDQIMQRTEDRRAQRMNSGLELKRSLLAQQADQEVKENEKM